jgi:hypothetical protein
MAVNIDGLIFIISFISYMQNQLSSYPDMAAYHCIAVTLGQVGLMKELFDVIDCMCSPPPFHIT